MPVLKKKNFNKIHPLYIVLIISTLTALVGAFFDKNFYIDEIFAFGEANSSRVVMFFGNDFLDVSYTADEAEDYLCIKNGAGFDYFTPYFSAVNDNHPPMFFYLIHTVCSFAPNNFSKWQGFLVTFPFYIATNFLLYRLCRRFFHSKKKSLILTYIYALSPFGLWNVLIIRMYQPLAFFILLCVYSAIMYYKNHKGKYLLYYGLGIFYSSMLHYSAYFFNFSFTAFMCLALILSKKSVFDGVKLGLSALSGVACAVLAYPFVVFQFSFTTTIRENWRNRSNEAAENLGNIIKNPVAYLVILPLILFVIKKNDKNIPVFGVIFSIWFSSLLINSMYVLGSPRYYFFIMPALFFSAAYFINLKSLKKPVKIISPVIISSLYLIASFGAVYFQDGYKAHNFRTYFDEKEFADLIRGKDIIIAAPSNDIAATNKGSEYVRDLTYILTLFYKEYNSVSALYLPEEQFKIEFERKVDSLGGEDGNIVVIGFDGIVSNESNIIPFKSKADGDKVIKGWQIKYVFFDFS